MYFRPYPLLTIIAIPALVVLVMLGVWQSQRAGWKSQEVVAFEQRMQAPPQSIVGAILRGMEIIIPRGPDQVRPQDRLIVFAAADSVAAVRDYFASA